KLALETLVSAYRANGDLRANGIMNDYYKAGNIAMCACPNNPLFLNPENFDQLNWDISYFPGFEDEPTVQGAFGVQMLASTSKNKDLAIHILYQILTDKKSLENQKA